MWFKHTISLFLVLTSKVCRQDDEHYADTYFHFNNMGGAHCFKKMQNFFYTFFLSLGSNTKAFLTMTRQLTSGLSLTSNVSLSFASLREDGAISVMAAVATAAAVRDDKRRVARAGERDRLRRRPGERERERERERVWKPVGL